MALVTLGDGWLESAIHEEEPEDESDEEQDLPYSAEVNVFVSLRAEPEPQVAELLLNAEPLAGKRSDYDRDERDKQCVHARALKFGLLAAYGRSDEESSGKPRGG